MDGGYLWKVSGSHALTRSWKRRYFRLDGTKLLYYRNRVRPSRTSSISANAQTSMGLSGQYDLSVYNLVRHDASCKKPFAIRLSLMDDMDDDDQSIKSFNTSHTTNSFNDLYRPNSRPVSATSWSRPNSAVGPRFDRPRMGSAQSAPSEKPKSLILLAENEKEMMNWIELLRAVLREKFNSGLPSSLRENIVDVMLSRLDSFTNPSPPQTGRTTPSLSTDSRKTSLESITQRPFTPHRHSSDSAASRIVPQKRSSECAAQRPISSFRRSSTAIFQVSPIFDEETLAETCETLWSGDTFMPEETLMPKNMANNAWPPSPTSPGASSRHPLHPQSPNKAHFAPPSSISAPPSSEKNSSLSAKARRKSISMLSALTNSLHISRDDGTIAKRRMTLAANTIPPILPSPRTNSHAQVWKS